MSETTAKVGVIIGTKADAAPVDRYTASVHRMRDAISNLFTSKNAATAGAAFGGSFAAAGLSVEKMLGKITEAIGGSAELASEMALVERRAGLAGEAFQVLGRSGRIASDELIASLAKYRVKLGDALGGDLDARKIFSGLGQSPEALTKMPMERQLELIGSALGRFGDKNREAAAAQDMFGKGYAAMVPLLEKLRTEGYDKLRAKVSETAGVLENDMSRALTKSKKEAAEATNQLSINLAQTNLRLLKMKTAITETLSDNAGTIQSAGTALAGGFLSATVLTQIANRIGPQLNVIGSQAAGAFSKGFGVGAALLPGIIAERMSAPGAMASFAGLGRALATPFGAAFALVLGGFLIAELERLAMEEIHKRDAESAAAFSRIDAIKAAIAGAASAESAAKGQADAAKTLSEIQTEIDRIDALKTTMAGIPRMVGLGLGMMPRPEISEADTERLARLQTERAIMIDVVKSANDKGAAIAANNAAQRDATDLAFVEAAEMEKVRGAREGLLDREKQERLEALVDDRARLELLQTWRAEEEAASNKKIAATKNTELAGHREIEKRVRLLDIDAKIAQVRHKIAQDAVKSAEQADRELTQTLERFDKENRNAIARKLDAKMTWAAVERARVDGDFTETEAAKWGRRSDDLQRRTLIVREAMAELETQRGIASAGGLPTDQHEGELQQSRNQLSQLEIEGLTKGPNPTSWVEQTAAALVQLQDQWGTTAQQVAGTISGTIGGAVDSVAENITQALLVTGDWNQALGNVALSIGTELVRAIVTMGARWVATRIMMAIMDKVLAQTTMVGAGAVAAETGAAWAGPATLATIATMGGAAAQAPFSIAAAMAVTQALAAVPGFSEGGYTGKDGGIVHPEEYVLSARALDALGGPAAADMLHDQLLSGSFSPASPPAALGGGGGGKTVRFIAVIDDGSAAAQEKIARMEQNPEFRNIIKRMGRDFRADWGIDL